MPSSGEQLTVQVKGEEPLSAPPALFSNFLGISRVALDVQFEFIFLDLNQLAQILQQQPGKDKTGAPIGPVEGQTVAKVIMPAAAFVQLKEHISRLMLDIEKNLAQLDGAVNENKTKHGATGS